VLVPSAISFNFPYLGLWRAFGIDKPELSASEATSGTSMGDSLGPITPVTRCDSSIGQTVAMGRTFFNCLRTSCRSPLTALVLSKL